MREILFRGKFSDNGNWIEGSLIVGRDLESGQLEYFIAPLSAFYTEVKKVVPESVSEFTGLTDKNGKKIFEGDIVKYGDSINKVVFEQRNGTAYFGVVMDDTETWHFCHLTNAVGMEIIGNIHDNPELLKGK